MASFPDKTSRRPASAFNDRWLRALKPGDTACDYRDAIARGLIARVLPSGRVQFSVRYRYQGKQRRLALGEYPSTSLVDARKRARRAQTAVDDGRDPAAEQQAAKAVRTDTVDALAKDYLDKHARKFKKSADEDERILDVEVLPRWSDKSVRAITRRDVRALVERVADRAPVMGNRVLAVVRKMLNFAVDHDWIEANPAARVQKPSPEASRDRVLTDDELRRLWRVLSHFPTTGERPAPRRKRATGAKGDPLCPIGPALAALLKLRLLTAQRGGECARMKWAHLDLETGWWTIPGSDTKNGEPHRVFLAEAARALIRAQLPPDGSKPDVDGYVFVGRGGAVVLARAKKAAGAVAALLGLDIRGHDLRRTGATRMAAAGVPREHIAHVLNHVDGGPRATKVYDRYAYDRERQIALETWARALAAILKGTDASKIVPFARA